ncbi:MAG: cache domain-containing protein, partial [Prochloraceae cyanobacterium]|nr:cache domain-containing protein [Prochloraceae cyanobacterium]
MKLVNSLKFKIGAFVILGILPAACLSFLFATSLASESLAKKTEEILEIKVAKIRDNIENSDRINTGILRFLSSQPSIISMNPDEQIPMLTNTVASYSQIYRAMTIDTEGYNVSRNDSRKRAYRGDRPYFINAIEGEEISRQVLVGRTTGQTSICMGRAIVAPNTEIVGVVTICSYLNKMAQHLEQLEFGKTGYAIVVDRNGIVLAHPNPAYRVADELQSLADFAPVKNLLENGNKNFKFQYEGETWISQGTRLDNGWGVVVVMSEAEFLADEKNFKETMAFIGILGIIGLTTGSIVLANYTIAPISKLTEMAIALSHGQYDRRVRIDRLDEFGILANTFNQMGKKIGLKQQYLEAAVKKQTQAIELDKKRVVNALARAEKADRAKEEFLFKLSHELKTPLNAIIGYANQIKKTQPNDKDINTILQSA